MHKFLFLTLFTFLFSQAEITNIQASMRTDGTGVIDISYDLLPDDTFNFFEISVEYSLDGGSSWNEMSYHDGDFGEIIEPGNGKIIIWNFKTQLGEIYTDELQIRINGYAATIINDNNNEDLPFEMISIPAGAFTFGEIDSIVTIDYDYEIMKYEVTDYDYTIFMLSILEDEENVLQPIVNESGMSGYYPGDAEVPSGVYNYINFSNSKISYNGEIFEVNEGNVNHPVTGVTWFGAWAFSVYYGLDVPNQYEWEKAARGITGYDYPVGDSFSIENGNYIDNNFDCFNIGRPTTPVGTFNGQELIADIDGNSLEISNLFISEYGEGSSNNKYIEVYNGTTENIDLSNYAFAYVGNSPDIPGEYEYWVNFECNSNDSECINETIQPNDVWVICHPSAEGDIQQECDQNFTYLSNGDDGWCLVYGSENSYSILDCVGDWYEDPGIGWDVCGVENGTKDHTLIRKPNVPSGNLGNWNDTTCEWDVYEQNYWNDIGYHYALNLDDFCQDSFFTSNSPSPFGAYDLSGNVSEIINDMNNFRFYSKGGSYSSDLISEQLKVWSVEEIERTTSSSNIGFRCVKRNITTNRKINNKTR